MTPSPWWWAFAAALVAAAVYLTVPGMPALARQAAEVLASNDIGRARAWVAQFGVWGPAIILLFMVVQAVIPVLPSVAVMVVSTLAYGPVWGGLLAWSGLMVAASIGYLMGRVLGEGALARIVGENRMRGVQGLMDRYGLWAVVAARVSPLISTDAVSIAAGLGRMDFARFMTATALGTLPLTLLIAVLAEDFQRMTVGLTVVSVVSLLALGLYVWWDRRRTLSE